MIEQFRQCPARIEKPAPVLGVLGCQQDLCRNPVESCERRLVGVDELYLTRRRRGLQLGKSRTPLDDVENGTANRDRAGRDDQDFVPVFGKGVDIFGQAVQPGAVQPSVVGDE